MAKVAADGELRPDPSAPGFGLVFKRRDAETYRVALESPPVTRPGEQ